MSTILFKKKTALKDAKPSTTLKGLKNTRNKPILTGSYIDFEFKSVPRDHEKFAFTRICVDVYVI